MTRTRPRGARVAALVAAAALALGACSPSAEPAPEAASTQTTTEAVEPAEKSAAPSPSASPEVEDPLGEGTRNMLLIGTDSRDASSMGGNADIIMLAHVPADREQLYLVSFTRDMHVPIPGIGEGKINSAFSRGGTQTLVDTVSELVGGLEIDYTMQTNFNGFINLTRALEGFEVDNKHHSTVTVNSTGRVVDFPEGRVTLENTDGLIYVRERKRLPLGDLDRTERQRAAVIGMMDRIAERSDDPAFVAELIALLFNNVKVTGDLAVEDFVDLAPMASELERDDVVSLMSPITGFGTVGGASVNLVDEAQTADLGEALRTDTMDEYVEEYGTDYAP
ncbi:LytR family transcriptional attenuator [Isoptericola sp. CG 20/1183]|uniref:LytR family transcriptional attenuator n=1 Tax=Isoptericola halotolerans TaxID=300560 RepID=A0ABX5EFA4_9MICO|nr:MULTISPECIES: LCP family protein [Isoptericola]PRZ08088.1 LytR family transcriptional attenuator [Isoptericola halotolerans]PRZ08886.1 LytR family transcriptional attenuator [Isoptericola sp. CG 20/1183]